MANDALKADKALKAGTETDPKTAMNKATKTRRRNKKAKNTGPNVDKPKAKPTALAKAKDTIQDLKATIRDLENKIKSLNKANLSLAAQRDALVEENESLCGEEPKSAMDLLKAASARKKSETKAETKAAAKPGTKSGAKGGTKSKRASKRARAVASGVKAIASNKAKAKAEVLKAAKKAGTKANKAKAATKALGGKPKNVTFKRVTKRSKDFGACVSALRSVAGMGELAEVKSVQLGSDGVSVKGTIEGAPMVARLVA